MVEAEVTQSDGGAIAFFRADYAHIEAYIHHTIW